MSRDAFRNKGRDRYDSDKRKDDGRNKDKYRGKDPIIQKMTELRSGKHDKIKCKTKEETKSTRGGCLHHYYNKKGKLKAAVVYSGKDNMFYCYMCGHSFRPDFYQKDEIKEITKDFVEMNNNIKFLAASVNAGQKTIKYFSDMGTLLTQYKKLASKVTKVAVKQNEYQSGKRKDRYEDRGYSECGHWVS